ncbi:hypothetical protein MSG28_013435 [Choristoneura fumiferana]|uniref:Uncharacterized protein n=1 Tax=Choristoneura fumiferana TaxID=7141 RepID=A0ACC0KU76_CHOFU|nr:hypothetical protein MSG28_013435 [Choristoneura fumiferana]
MPETCLLLRRNNLAMFFRLFGQKKRSNREGRERNKENVPEPEVAEEESEEPEPAPEPCYVVKHSDIMGSVTGSPHSRGCHAWTASGPLTRTLAMRRSPPASRSSSPLRGNSLTARGPLVVNSAPAPGPPVDNEWMPKVEAVLVGYLVARRDLRAGEVILEVPALAVGPCAGCGLVCLGCYRELPPAAIYKSVCTRNSLSSLPKGRDSLKIIAIKTQLST